MALQEKFQEDLKDSMRNGDPIRRSVIRYIRSKIHNEEIARQETLDDDAIIDLLSKQAQQRRDSIEAFRIGNRQDLVGREEAELAIILKYMPEQMSSEEITELAQIAVEEIEATGHEDMGKVMSRIMPQVKGRTNGKAVSQVVATLLNDLDGSR